MRQMCSPLCAGGRPQWTRLFYLLLLCQLCVRVGHLCANTCSRLSRNCAFWQVWVCVSRLCERLRSGSRQPTKRQQQVLQPLLVNCSVVHCSAEACTLRQQQQRSCNQSCWVSGRHEEPQEGGQIAQGQEPGQGVEQWTHVFCASLSCSQQRYSAMCAAQACTSSHGNR